MSEPRKIALVAACPFPYPRGTPIRILRMAEALAERGHNVHVITYHLGQKMEDLPFAVHRIAKVPTYKKLSPGPTYQKLLLLDVLLGLLIRKVVRDHQIEIIHAHHYEGMLAGLPAARSAGIPIVFDMHTRLSSELPHYELGLPSKLLYLLGNQLDHWLPPKADHIFTVTHALHDWLVTEAKIPEENVTAVYTGVESHMIAAQASSETDAVSRTLIYTGNLAAYQGVDLMLRAFRKVLDVRPDVILKIVTTSPLDPYADLVAAFDLQDHLVIENADYFQLPAQLHSARIALNPRVKCDGLPMKLLNYMATGRAIVSFEGSAEVLENEHTGLVVSDYDIDAFATAILRLLENPELAGRLGGNAQSHVHEFFIWESAIKSLETVYERLLERRA